MLLLSFSTLSVFSVLISSLIHNLFRKRADMLLGGLCCRCDGCLPLRAGAPQFFLVVAITRAFVSSHRILSDSLWYQMSPTGLCSSAGVGVGRTVPMLHGSHKWPFSQFSLESFRHPLGFLEGSLSSSLLSLWLLLSVCPVWFISHIFYTFLTLYFSGSFTLFTLCILFSSDF